MPTPRQQYDALRQAVDELGELAIVARAAKAAVVVALVVDLLGELVDSIETLQGVPHGKNRTPPNRHR